MEKQLASASLLKQFTNEMKSIKIPLNEKEEFLLDLTQYEKKMFKLPINTRKYGLKDHIG